MIIVKKTKGKKVYYYLHHSIRKWNNILAREKYLGKKIPKNINKIKEQFKRELMSSNYDILQKIKDNFQKEWKRLPKSAKISELEKIAIAFTYNTNAIEGSKITLRETKEIIENKIAPKKSLYDIRETEMHYKVFLKMLEKKEILDEKLILKWHKEIFNESKPDLVGNFRTYFVTVGGYMAPDWRKVKRLMKELVKFIDENKNMNAVELAAIAHYKFESIHTFGDGNGRVGRLLMNYILWFNNYPMIIIENKKKWAYYKAFKNGKEGFVNYFIKNYIKVHKRFS